MTDQVPTQYVRFRGKSYILLTADKALFSLWDHDIHPEDTDSSNWAGFVAHFDIHDEQLYLDYLTVGHTPPARKRVQRSPSEDRHQLDAALDELIGDYYLPPLNDVAPTDAGMGYWHYENINLALDYTGTMTLGGESSQEQQDHLELVLEQGKVISWQTIPAPEPETLFDVESEGDGSFKDIDFDDLLSEGGLDGDDEPPRPV